MSLQKPMGMANESLIVCLYVFLYKKEPQMGSFLENCSNLK